MALSVAQPWWAMNYRVVQKTEKQYGCPFFWTTLYIHLEKNGHSLLYWYGYCLLLFCLL